MYLVSINLIESHTGRYIPHQGFLLQGNSENVCFEVSIQSVDFLCVVSYYYLASYVVEIGYSEMYFLKAIKNNPSKSEHSVFF